MHYLITKQLSLCSGLDFAVWEALLFVTLCYSLLLILYMILVRFFQTCPGMSDGAREYRIFSAIYL